MNEYWWTAEDPHGGVLSSVAGIEDAQSYREGANMRYMSLYGNGPVSDLRTRPEARSQRHRITLNVIQSMCDTLTAKIAKAKPKATFLTDGGSYEMQKRAKRLDKYVRGQFYATNIYNVMPKVFLDSLVFGSGFLHVFEGDDGINVERVFPSEILVDEIEARYASPRQFFRKKIVNRDVLLAMFPEKTTEIMLSSQDRDASDEYTVMEGITVIEAFHLKSSKNSTDGRRVICVEGGTLLDEEYNRDYAPYVKIDWTSRLYGYFGQGLAEQLNGIHIEIQKLLEQIQQQMHLARPKVFIEHGSQISRAHINNQNWGVIEYRNTPPQFVTPRTVSGEIFSHLDRLYARAYEIAGISSLSAQSKKPAGIESAVALRELGDIETERFMLVAQGYERAFLEAAKIMIDIARDMALAGRDLEAITMGDRDMEKIKWSEIDLKDDQYVMKVFPTNLLPHTPAGKLQRVIEMLQAQMLTRTEARRLLDYPDLSSVTSLANAPHDEIDMIIDSLLNGVYMPPEPFTNLTLAIKRMGQAYTKAKVQGVAEDRLELIRRYVLDAQTILATAAQSMQQAAQPMAPQAANGQGDFAQPSGTMPRSPSVEAAERMAAPIQTPQ